MTAISRRLAVGDIQGCFAPLEQLLRAAAFDPARDQLWSVGDLVNRGPQSLETLRFFHGLGDAARVVLGNHDLHLLAVAEGIRPLKRGDTLAPILAAPDAPALLDWLRRQPLFIQEDGVAMAHAGIAPEWTLEQAAALAGEVAALLRGPRYRDFLAAMYGDQPDRWSDTLDGPARWRVITNYLTRMRFLRSDGSLDLAAKDEPAAAPAGLLPWFERPGNLPSNTLFVFGHWAALMGRVTQPNLLALDTGCVWGECMTLVDLASRERWTQRCSAQP